MTWVVDLEDDNSLLPPDVVGELLLEGRSLARDYLENPEKTTEVFIANVPWLQCGTGRRQGRLYKIGNLVYYQEERSLLYVGRKDTQVKIHGQRVEIGEIEHHIQQLLPKGLELRVSADLATPKDTKIAVWVVFASFGGLEKTDSTRDEARSA